MQLSKKTLEILKNFSTINSNFYCSGGKTVKTISAMKNILGSAEVEEDLPEFGLYDLSEFLSLITSSLYTTPVLEFKEKSVDIIEEGDVNSRTEYYFASKDILTTSDKVVTLPSEEVKFILTKRLLHRITTAGSILQLSDIILECKDGVVSFGVIDKNSGNANTHKVVIDNMDTSVPYKFYFKSDNLRMIPDDYEVTISEKGISRFKSNSVEYWIALEPTSTYG
jgi:hypothetical protein